MDFKKRLYSSYTTQHVRFNANTLRQGHAYLSRVVSQCFPKEKSIRIVDLGCGYGALLKVLQFAGYADSHGVDTSPEQVQLAQTLGIRNVIQGDIYQFLTQLADQSVDVFVAFDVLEHLTGEELLMIGDEMSRALTDRGRFILHVPNAGGIFGSAIRYGDLTHERAFTASSLSQFAEAVGMKLERVYEDRPAVHGMVSLVRRLIWDVGTLPIRLISLAETGVMPAALSRNMLAVVVKKTA